MKQETGKLTIAYLAAIVICIVFLALSLMFVRNTMLLDEQENIQYLYDVAEQNRTAIRKQVQGDLQTLDGVAACIGTMTDSDFDDYIFALQEINNNNNFIRMGIADKRGITNIVDVDGTIYEQVDYSDAAFMQAALRGGRTVSNTIKDRFSDQYVTCYAVPIRRNGEITGALCAVNHADVFRYILEASVFNGNGFSHLVQSDGTFIIRSAHPNANPGALRIEDMGQIDGETLAGVRDTMAQGRSGFFSYESGNGKQLVAYAPVGVKDWYIISVVSQNLLNRNYSHTAFGVFIIILSALGIFALLAYYIIRVSNKSRQALERMAYTDSLTGCPSYAKFEMDAEHILKGERAGSCALWYCDFKKFKYLNDLLGYDAGDRLLCAMAGELERDCGTGDAFCRVSADNFAGLRHYRKKKELDAWFHRLIGRLAESGAAKSRGYRLEASMGIFCPEESDGTLSVNDMINRAIMAQKTAKLENGSAAAHYSSEMRDQVYREAELESMMERALEQNEFKVYLQPKVDIQNGNVLKGVEVLARWQSAEKGLIQPGDFIPLFEKNGFIVQMDRYMFETVCRWVRGLLDAGNLHFMIAINVSRLGLFQEDFLSYYIGVKNRYGIPDHVLELEFTESVVLDNDVLFRSTVVELQKNGFDCALDDFGAGYSSLNVLKDLPMNVIKLDMLFFRGERDLDRSRTVIASVVSLARKLEMETVSEGVETREQVEFLKNTGCNLVQGYVFAKPMPLEEFCALLESAPDGRIAYSL